MINSRDKGARAERLFRDQLRERGYTAIRSQQYCGSADSADVISPELAHLHFEVKAVQRFNLWDAMNQAIRDSEGRKTPIVAYKRNNHEWLVTMRASDWLDMLKLSLENS